MQIDSGASCNVLPKKYFPGVAEIQKSKLITSGKSQHLEQQRVSSRNPRTRKRYNAEFNEALHRSNYPLPVIEDILPELGKARVFSKADLKDRFLQIELDD